MRYPAFWILAAMITAPHLPVGIKDAAAAHQASQVQNPSPIPDFSGVWFTQGKVRANFSFGGNSPLLPWAAERLKTTAQEVNPGLLCFPPGVPRIWTEPYPFEIISLPGRVLIYYEYEHLVRQIHTDSRDHPKDVIPTWMGDSIGKWEADTLVVDTIGFNDQTFIDSSRLPHSDALHVVERIRRVNHDVLQVDITIDDPKAYEKPWKAQRTYDLKPDWEISEQVCEENNSYIATPNKTEK